MTDETRITHELTRRAEDVHGGTLTLDDVRGRARSIRRRRRAAGGAVAAAVALAVITPFALAGGSDSSAPDPAPQPAVAPGASVLHDGVLTKPDGTTVPVDVDNADVVQLAVLTDGRIVVATQHPFAVEVHAPDGSFSRRYPVTQNIITTSAQDDAVAWVADDNTVRVLSSGSAEPAVLPGIPMPGQEAGGIDAVLDAEHLLVGDHTTTTAELTPAGMVDLTTSEPFRVVDVSPDGGLWAVAFIPTVENEQFGCVGLYDPEAEQMVVRSCDVSGLRFSPDGQHLLSLRGDNNMFGEGTTLDLDLEPVGSFESAGAGHVISRAAWADADHLLVAETDWKTSSWSLDRVDLDWEAQEEVVPEEPGRNPEAIQEFVFSE